MGGKILAAWVVLGMASVALADSVDDAEAKQRGVAVEVVQLDHAKDRIATLEKENAALKAQVAKLNATVAAAQKNQPKVAATEPATYQLKNGMTLAEAKAAVPGEWVLIGESNGVQHYSCRWRVPDSFANQENERRIIANGGLGNPATVWTTADVAQLDVEGGKVTNYSIETEGIKNWRLVGGGPPDEVAKKQAQPTTPAKH